MENNNEPKKSNKRFWIGFFIFTFLFCVIVAMMLPKCSGEIKKHLPNYDSLKTAYFELQEKAGKLDIEKYNAQNELDSLRSQKPKIVIKYISAKESVLNSPCDTLKIIRYVNVTDSLLHQDSLIIAKHDTLQTMYKNIILNREQQLDNRNKVIDEQKIDLKLSKKEIKKQKRLKVIAIGGGILAVLATILVSK